MLLEIFFLFHMGKESLWRGFFFKTLEKVVIRDIGLELFVVGPDLYFGYTFESFIWDGKITCVRFMMSFKG